MNYNYNENYNSDEEERRRNDLTKEDCQMRPSGYQANPLLNL